MAEAWSGLHRGRGPRVRRGTEGGFLAACANCVRAQPRACCACAVISRVRCRGYGRPPPPLTLQQAVVDIARNRLRKVGTCCYCWRPAFYSRTEQVARPAKYELSQRHVRSTLCGSRSSAVAVGNISLQ